MTRKESLADRIALAVTAAAAIAALVALLAFG